MVESYGEPKTKLDKFGQVYHTSTKDLNVGSVVTSLSVEGFEPKKDKAVLDKELQSTIEDLRKKGGM
jgi:hypothetical protein